MSETATYRLAPHATFRATSSDLKMLFDRERGVMYELNETGSRIVALLHQEPRGVAELVGALAAEYDAPEDEIRRDVEQLVEDFVNARLLTVDAVAGVA